MDKVYIAGYKQSEYPLTTEFDAREYQILPIAYGSFQSCEAKMKEDFMSEPDIPLMWYDVPNVGEYVLLSNSFKTHSLKPQMYVQLVVFESTVR